MDRLNQICDELADILPVSPRIGHNGNQEPCLIFMLQSKPESWKPPMVEYKGIPVVWKEGSRTSLRAMTAGDT
jgi:hypothetical protein